MSAVELESAQACFLNHIKTCKICHGFDHSGRAIANLCWTGNQNFLKLLEAEKKIHDGRRSAGAAGNNDARTRPIDSHGLQRAMTRHAAHQMHINSLDAYREELPRLGARAQRILDHFTAHPHVHLTDREVCAALHLPEPNSVRPRITELIQRGFLVEYGSRRCELTRKTVRLVGLPQK